MKGYLNKRILYALSLSDVSENSDAVKHTTSLLVLSPRQSLMSMLHYAADSYDTALLCGYIEAIY